jgi:hypothetical protein
VGILGESCQEGIWCLGPEVKDGDQCFLIRYLSTRSREGGASAALYWNAFKQSSPQRYADSLVVDETFTGCDQGANYVFAFPVFLNGGFRGFVRGGEKGYVVVDL